MANITCGLHFGSATITYIHLCKDFPKSLEYGMARLFAHDARLPFLRCSSVAALQDEMTRDLKEIRSWRFANELTANVSKMVSNQQLSQ